MEQLILHMIHTEQLIILNLVILGFRTIHSTQSERPPVKLERGYYCCISTRELL